jgi:plastocyanin
MHRRVVAVAAVAIAIPVSYAGIAAAHTQRPAQSAAQNVGLKEFAFRMRSHLKTGKTAFTFRNRGQFPHNFTVVAALGGGKAFKTANIQPGKQLQRTVNLKPGVYVAVCTVFNGGHLAQGMEKTFTFGTFDQQKGTWGP